MNYEIEWDKIVEADDVGVSVDRIERNVVVFKSMFVVVIAMKVLDTEIYAWC